MAIRCPTSTYVGIARLAGYKWIINDRGYANVVQTAAPDASVDRSDDCVWGVVFELLAEDERRLDINEGVPNAYTKEMLPTRFWAAKDQLAKHTNWDTYKLDTQQSYKEVNMLVYIDRVRTTPSKPKAEYVIRMNKGIKDALKLGVPPEYVDRVIRQYIPEDSSDDGEDTQKLALKQAANFEDE